MSDDDRTDYEELQRRAMLAGIDANQSAYRLRQALGID